MSSKTDKLTRQNFIHFAGLFNASVKQGLIAFFDYIVDKQVIPYKIKNKEFSILVADTVAFTIELKFHNVIIEDGRHPREILITNISGEKVDEPGAMGRYRIRFVNSLVTEGIVKESAFVFDDLTVSIDLWNYNFSTYDFSVGDSKVPWRLIYEPAAALMDKWQVLGEQDLNTYEIEHATIFQFLHTYLGLYLDEQTYVGYGKSSINYDQAFVSQYILTKRQQLAAKKLFEICQWQDMIGLLEKYNENEPTVLFEAWVHKITSKEGRILFDYVNEMLVKCTRDYPRHRKLLPIYAGSRSLVQSMLDELFVARGYEGTYPVYIAKDKARFIETSLVYERKYTFINAKHKLHMFTFIESIVDGGLHICAAQGTVYLRDNAEKNFLNNALYCFFADGGRRSVGITESIYIEPETDREELKEDIRAFFNRLTK